MKKSRQEANATEANATEAPALKPYQVVDEDSGEVTLKYKYLEGRPRQYRFDAKEGVFNIGGSEKLGHTFRFQPLAWRIFEDDILQMGKKKWAEIFFIDAKNCVSGILFHSWSVENLYKLIEPLYYDGLTLADVVITAQSERKENTKITPKGVYYIAEFTYEVADQEKVKEFQSFVTDFQVYREETITELAQVQLVHHFSYPADVIEQKKELEPAGQ